MQWERWDDKIESILQNPEQITFALLFTGLLYWTIKTSEKREDSLRSDNREREDKLQNENNDRELRYQSTIDKLTDSLKDIEGIKATIEQINDKLK